MLYGFKNYVMFFSVLSLTGCATMFNSGSQTIQAIPTQGDGVKVNVTTPSGSYATKLPTTIVAEPSTFTNVAIDVIDTCYEPTHATVASSVTPSYFADIIFWPALIVDALTGNMWKYHNTVSVTTVPKSNCKS